MLIVVIMITKWLLRLIVPSHPEPTAFVWMGHRSIYVLQKHNSPNSVVKLVAIPKRTGVAKLFRAVEALGFFSKRCRCHAL